MPSKDSTLAALYASLVVLTKTSLWVFTPLFLDSLNPTSTVLYNVSVGPSYANFSGNSGTKSSTSSLDPFSGIAFSAAASGRFVPHVSYINSTPSWQRIDPLFGIWFSMGFDTFLLGSIVLYLLFFTKRITDREKNYPKFSLILSGSFQAVSGLMYQFSTSGSRTAPYLQGALGYFFIPITFSLR